VIAMTGNLFDLSGRVALVTGTSRGLGAAMAQALAAAGADVAVHDRERPCATEEAIKHMGRRSWCLGADLSDRAAADRMVDEAIEQAGRIDILVNNAGTAWGAKPQDTPLHGWQKVIDVNLTGVFLCTQAAGRVMIDQGRGKVVNIASITGLRGSRPEVLDAIAYSSAKGAVIAFTRDLAWKWARHGIGVNAIAPGWFDTGLSRPVLDRAGDDLLDTIPLRRLGGANDLKGAIGYLASAASDYVTGHTLVVDGGASA
jgi:NAD(P)-dependent dehydrogenase (short-subunit alcohol dehydrogenase family)